MPWARLDDRINNDAKLLALSDAAHRMWTCGLAYCSFNLTDGFIPEHAIHAFGVRAPNKTKVAAELCTPSVQGKRALWSKVEDGYRFNDYLDWNDSREKVLAERELAKKRLERFQGKRGLKRVVNAVVNAFITPHETGLETSSERCTTYHVPEEPEKQEHAQSAEPQLHDVRIRMLRRERSRETANGQPAVRVIAALARHVMTDHPEYDEGELMEAVKRQCARSNLEYSGVVGAAIDRARAQVQRQKAQAS
jgi:hypothetical protein